MKSAQAMIEYVLIAALVAVVFGYMFSKMDISKLKSYIFNQPAGEQTNVIKVRSMTWK